MEGENCYCVDPVTGTQTFCGSVKPIAGKHNGMPSRTDDDLPVYVRGFFKAEPGITERLRGDTDEREFLQYLRSCNWDQDL